MEENGKADSDIECILCSTSEENEVTGPMSCENNVAAHQNCLLYASGIFCKNSPTFNDLFGFDTDDVRKEAHRGSKLTCYHCKKKGATVGCEKRSCKRSYHYPCAQMSNARPVENIKKGIFKLYCEKHYLRSQKAGVSGEQLHSRSSSKSPEGCRLFKTPGETSSESDTSTPLRSSAKKRKSHRISSDSDEPPNSMFAPLEIEEEQNVTPQKRRIEDSLFVSPSTHEDIVSVLQNHGVGTLTTQTSRDEEEPRAGTSGDADAEPHDVRDDNDDDDDDETDVELDAESQSLLHSEKVLINVIVDSGLSSEFSPSPASMSESLQIPAVCNPSPPHSPQEHSPSLLNEAPTPKTLGNPLPSDSPLDFSGPAPFCTSPSDVEPPEPSSSRRTMSTPARDFPFPAPAQDTQKLFTIARRSTATAEPSISTARRQNESKSDAALFWRRCDDAGCTEAVFKELEQQIDELADKMKQQRATEEDYDVSLRLLKASGKLPSIFKRLDQDLQERETELRKKRKALKDAKSALGDGHFS